MKIFHDYQTLINSMSTDCPWRCHMDMSTQDKSLFNKKIKHLEQSFAGNRAYVGCFYPERKFYFQFNSIEAREAFKNKMKLYGSQVNDDDWDNKGKSIPYPTEIKMTNEEMISDLKKNRENLEMLKSLAKLEEEGLIKKNNL